ncbi:XdhC family protein [Paenalcaligenes sp. Me131]|uniref:XdhC family protein n=1 Tax=Paenalcaligenes sp. Me131 TaxID=3392636 RepID=UPI003D293182
MNAMDLDVLQHAHDWVMAGHTVHLVTVVQTWGSAPRQAGAMLVVREDGRLMGSVSGGCIEDDLIRKAKNNELGTKPAPLLYGVSQAEAARFGLPCGGTLKLMVEPIADTQWLDKVLEAIRQHRLLLRTVSLSDGSYQLAPATPDMQTALSDTHFQSVYGPHWHLLIIGANQTARTLCAIANALDFHVTVCDPRKEFFEDWDVPYATLVTTMPDDTIVEMGVNHRTAIVALTHDPKLDDMALLEALISPAFYVGALGSKANQVKRRERLKLFDLTDTDIDRLHGPVGLPISSRTPAEIAVAIAAELIQVRNRLPVESQKSAA